MAKWTKQDIIGMTISELIEKTTLKVKLGANNGSGFVYCGHINEIDIDTLDKSIVDAYKATYEKSLITIAHLTQKPKGYHDFIKERNNRKRSKVARTIKENKGKPLTEQQEREIDKEFDVSQLAYKCWLNELHRKLQTATDTKKSMKRKIDTFTTLRSRKVKDAYKSITEENTYILIYDGSERGFAWTTEEFERGYADYGEDD